MYAVIETGGKQYKVAPGETVDVEHLGVAEGNAVELDRVLLIADGDSVTLGKPAIPGAKVMAISKGDGKGKKVTVFKYKAKVRYRVKTGHRQPYTRLSINKISQPGAEKEQPSKPRRRKKEVTEGGA